MRGQSARELYRQIMNLGMPYFPITMKSYICVKLTDDDFIGLLYANMPNAGT